MYGSYNENHDWQILDISNISFASRFLIWFPFYFSKRSLTYHRLTLDHFLYSGLSCTAFESTENYPFITSFTLWELTKLNFYHPRSSRPKLGLLVIPTNFQLYSNEHTFLLYGYELLETQQRFLGPLLAQKTLPLFVHSDSVSLVNVLLSGSVTTGKIIKEQMVICIRNTWVFDQSDYPGPYMVLCPGWIT